MWECPSVVKSSGVGEPDLKECASDGGEGEGLGSSIVAILMCLRERESRQ